MRFRTPSVVFVALLALAGGYGLSSLMPGSNEQAEPSYSFAAEDAAKAEALIRALPPHCQAALIGSRYGLFFTPGGGDAYNSNEQYSADEKTHYYAVFRNAQLVDFDGKVHRFYDIIGERDRIKNAKAQWIAVMQYIGRNSDEVIFAPFKPELIRLAQQAAKYHLSSMSKEFRTAWLAQQACLLSTPDGQNFFTGRVTRKRVPGTHTELITRDMSGNPQYADAKGKKRDFNEIYRKLNGHIRARAAWEYASYCAAIVGSEAILSVFPDEVADLRKANAK